MKRSVTSSFSETTQAATSFIEEAKNDKEGKTAIHFAASKNDIPAIEYLIQKEGHNVREKDKHGRTAIHYAAHHGHQSMIDYLAKKGLYVNQTDNHGCTAAHYAADNAQNDMIKHLVTRHSLKLYPGDNLGLTPLHFAAQRGHDNTVRLLGTEYRLSLNGKTNKGNTALDLAVWQGHDSTVRLLISMNDDIKNDFDNAVTDGSIFKTFNLDEINTALQLAAQKNHHSMVHFLIEKGASPAKNFFGETVLKIAFNNDHFKLVDDLLSKYPELRMNELGKELWESLQTNITLADFCAQSLPSELLLKIASFTPAYMKLQTQQNLHYKGWKDYVENKLRKTAVFNF